MSFDFEHLKKLCVCRRFKTEGFDYGEHHRVLGRCGPGQRWTEPRDQIEFLERKYKGLESQNETLKADLKRILQGWPDISLEEKKQIETRHKLKEKNEAQLSAK